MWIIEVIIEIGDCVIWGHGKLVMGHKEVMLIESSSHWLVLRWKSVRTLDVTTAWSKKVTTYV